MSWCIPKYAVDAFIKSLPEDMSKLISMTSAERRAFFESTVGPENAKRVNALIESKFILKNQELGLINAIKSITGIKTTLPRDMLTKVQRISEVLQPKDVEAFLADFVDKRLGMGVTVEEAGKIAHLAKEVETAKTSYQEGLTKAKTEIATKLKTQDEAVIGRELDKLANTKGTKLYDQSMEYGIRLVEFKNYISELKTQAGTLRVRDYLKNPFRITLPLLNITKSLWSALDNSFQLRQAIPLLLMGKWGTWAKGFAKSWEMMGKQFVAPNEGGLFSNQKDIAVNALKAWAYSRPLAMDGTFTRGELAIGIKGEEAFPSSIPGRIPGIGRLFGASEAAYNGTALKLRVELATKYFRDAQEQGVNILNKDEAKGIGNIINAMTGRGRVTLTPGQSEFVNAAFFSIRYAKSAWDTMTAHTFGTGLDSSFAKKAAAVNTIKLYAGLTTLFLLANTLDPEMVDTKKHLGKLKIAGKWVNVAGGMSSIAQTAQNIAMFLIQQSKTNKLPKYGQQTGMDIFWGFWEGKASPLFSVMRDYLRGRTFQGKKPTVKGELINLAKPLPVQSFEQIMKQTDGGDTMLLTALELLGASVSTPPKKKP